MKLLGLDINSGDQNHISLSNGHFFNQENEYKQLIDHLMQQKVDGIVIGINGYGSRKIVPVLKKVIQRINIVVHLIEEKSTSVICSSCGFRKIKKGKFNTNSWLLDNMPVSQLSSNAILTPERCEF